MVLVCMRVSLSDNKTKAKLYIYWILTNHTLQIAQYLLSLAELVRYLLHTREPAKLQQAATVNNYYLNSFSETSDRRINGPLFQFPTKDAVTKLKFLIHFYVNYNV